MNAKNEVYNEVKNFVSYSTDSKIFKEYKAKKHAEKLDIAKKLIERRNNPAETIPVKKWLDLRLKNQIEPKLDKLAEGLPSMGYSMGERMIVKYLYFTGESNTCEEYARSCKYKPVHGHFMLKIDGDTLKNAENIGGMFTYILPGQKHKVKKCWWYESTGEKQYYDIRKVHGYVFAGYHSTDKKQAKEGGKRNIEREKERVRLSKQLKKQHIEAEKRYKKALRLQYSFKDSLDSGNCETGTKAFIIRCGLDADKKYRGKYLMDIADKKSTFSISYVKNMIEYKAMKLKK